MAIIFAVKTFRTFILRRKFILQIGYLQLLSTFDSKKGIPRHNACRALISSWNFHRQKIGHTDGLSRLISKSQKIFEESVKNPKEKLNAWCLTLLKNCR